MLQQNGSIFFEAGMNMALYTAKQFCTCIKP